MRIAWVCVVLINVQAGGDLIPRLQHKDSKVRLQGVEMAAGAGDKLEPKVIRVLVQILDDPDPKIRRAVVQAVGNLGPKAREWGGGPKLGDALFSLFQDKDRFVKKTAVWAYGRIGIDTKEELERNIAKAFGKPIPAIQQKLPLIVDVTGEIR